MTAKSLRNSGASRTRMSYSSSPSRSLVGHHAFDHAAQLRRHRGHLEAEVGGHRAVHLRHHLGLAALEGAVDVDRARDLAHLRDDLVAQALQGDHVVAAHEDVHRRLADGAPCMNSGSVTVAFIMRHRRPAAGARVGLDRQQAAVALHLRGGLHLQAGAQRVAVDAHRGEDLPHFGNAAHDRLHAGRPRPRSARTRCRAAVRPAPPSGRGPRTARTRCRCTASVDRLAKKTSAADGHDRPRVVDRPAEQAVVALVDAIVERAPALEEAADPRARAAPRAE